jgi:hypothetical protein
MSWCLTDRGFPQARDAAAGNNSLNSFHTFDHHASSASGDAVTTLCRHDERGFVTHPAVTPKAPAGARVGNFAPALLGEEGRIVPKPFAGVVNLDITKSTPDWGPYAQPVAPDGSPNVLYIVLDDVGFSAMQPFGGLIKTTHINKIADRGLPTPTSTRRLSAHRPGRACSPAATTRRTAWPASPKLQPGSPTRAGRR